MPRGGIGVALQSSRTTAHSSILGECDHATWPMVSIEKSDATGGIQQAADRSDAAFSPSGRDHGRLDARHRSGVPTSLRLDLRINQRLASTWGDIVRIRNSGAYAMIHMPRRAAVAANAALDDCCGPSDSRGNREH